MSIKEDFAKDTKMEGWGKTEAGKWIGYYSGGWHISKKNCPLDSKGNCLTKNSIAVDFSVIKAGSKVIIFI